MPQTLSAESLQLWMDLFRPGNREISPVPAHFLLFIDIKWWTLVRQETVTHTSKLLEYLRRLHRSQSNLTRLTCPFAKLQRPVIRQTSEHLFDVQACSVS